MKNIDKKLTKLIDNNGNLVDGPGYLIEGAGIFDKSRQQYPAGLDKQGRVYAHSVDSGYVTNFRGEQLPYKLNETYDPFEKGKDQINEDNSYLARHNQILEYNGLNDYSEKDEKELNKGVTREEMIDYIINKFHDSEFRKNNWRAIEKMYNTFDQYENIQDDANVEVAIARIDDNDVKKVYNAFQGNIEEQDPEGEEEEPAADEGLPDEEELDDMADEMDDEEDEMPEIEDVEDAGDEEIEGEEMGEETEEIDVTELVNTAQDTQEKVEQFTDKVDKIGSSIKDLESKLADMEKMIDKVEQMDKEIEDLEAKHPNPEEHLELVSLDSYPYNQDLDDYWHGEKEDMSRYRVKGQKDKGEMEPEDIDYSDVDIEKSFRPDEDNDNFEF